ncbi:hypothetical protein KGM_204982 [Danaus plexippus plexippus]|uniref:Uncharacterized protein n=1 Tax=Danaus plexippus plexippus TaxID=278856 RepID=A0A212FAJ1_DANPL|nr:hypothetical protein KGM_204982 [Danaus plexippus plexippus]
MPVHNDTELILMLIQIYPDVKRPARCIERDGRGRGGVPRCVAPRPDAGVAGSSGASPRGTRAPAGSPCGPRGPGASGPPRQAPAPH